MATPAGKSDPFDPLDIAGCMQAWGCLLKAAWELRAVDQEMMAAMMEAEVAAPAAGHRPQGPRNRAPHMQPRPRRDPTP